MRLGTRLWWIEVLLEPRDCWVGVFWIRKPAHAATDNGAVTEALHVYICLVPCVPIHLVLGKAVCDA